MHLINDVDLELTLRGGVTHVVAQFADLIHGIVGSTIDLDHIHRAALADRLHDRIIHIEVCVGPIGAIQRLRKNSGG